MNEIFNDVPKDPDTMVLASIPTKLDAIDILIEGWYWEGITGKSAVIPEEQVSKLTDEELISYVAPRMLITEPYTVSRNRDGYAFINYGFGGGD